MRLTRLGTSAAFVLAAAGSFAQEPPPPAPTEAPPPLLATASSRFRLRAEIKVNARRSQDVAVAVANTGQPFPIVLKTPDPHGSLEVQDVMLAAEADLTPDVSARASIHFLDLYNRNPTSSDDRVFVREAWIRFGRKFDVLRTIPKTTLYLQLGKAPRFSKQLDRKLESYGLWGTAVGRFEEVGAELGGTLGKWIYFRGSVVTPNPLFFRDPNALAGDNGTPERTEGSTIPVVYQSGFPILYDAKAQDVNFKGNFQYGGGIGFRVLGGEEGRDGVDVLGWVFTRSLADRVPIRGTFYSGDLRLLKGNGVSLPIAGREKTEWGANLDARFHGVSLFAQYVYQKIAGLPRKGVEAELAWRIPLNGVFVSGDTPVLNWIAPTVRYSEIANGTPNTPGFVAPSVTWTWYKYDFGFRLGILRGVDLTAEYARHDAILKNGRVIHPDELLTTLRAAF
jgi:hypothetical protein